MRRVLMSIVIVLAAGTTTERAVAREPTAADKETSRTLYAEGVRALEGHDFVAAERSCGGAFKLVSAPTGALCWAKAMEGLGKFAEARDAYLVAAHYPQKQDEPPVFAAARDDGRASAERVEKKIATVVLEVSGVGDSAPLRVAIDGVEIAGETARLPRRVNPGHHVIFVASKGYRTARVEVDADEGGEAQARVSLAPGDADEGSPSPAQTSKAPAFVLLAAGGVGLVVGTVFGAMALRQASALKTQTGCPSDCPSSAQSQIGALHRDQWVSDLGLAAGFVGIGVGSFLLLTSRAPDSQVASVRLDLGPGTIALRGRF